MGVAACFAAISPALVQRFMDDPDAIQDYLFPEDGETDPAHSMDVDKAWHGIHYMLTGQAEGGEAPLAWAIMGGKEVGDDIGLGPARLLTHVQVSMIAEALPDEDAFKAAFDPQAMQAAGIYPDTIWMRDGTSARDYVLEYYRDLVAFYRAAAQRVDGAVLWMC